MVRKTCLSLDCLKRWPLSACHTYYPGTYHHYRWKTTLPVVDSDHYFN